jgi:hypothetical protein
MVDCAHTPFTTSSSNTDVLNHGVSNIFHFDKEMLIPFPPLDLVAHRAKGVATRKYALLFPFYLSKMHDRKEALD